MRRQIASLWERQLIRYGCVGAGLAVFYVALAWGLDAAIPALPLWASSATSLVVTIALQYVLHAALTFRSELADMNQAVRFAITTGNALVLSTLATTLGQHWLSLPSVVVFAALSLAIPAWNYLFFSLWVFRPKA